MRCRGDVVQPADCRQRHVVEEVLRVPTAASSAELTSRSSNQFSSSSSSCNCWRHRAASCQRMSSRDRRTMTSSRMCIVVVLLLQLHLTSGSSSTAPVFDTFKSQHLRTFYGNRSSANNVPYFFTLYVDPANSSQIFVGGTDFVYKLNAEDIQSPYQMSENLTANPSYTNYVNSQLSCMQIGSLVNKTVQCRNHVRTIYRTVNSSEFYVCSTGANNPQEFYLSDNLQVISVQSSTSGLNKCPFDPLSDYVYTYVAQGNPSNLPALYTAVAVNNNPKSVTIIRPAIFANRFAPSPTVSLIKTDPDSTKWLNTDELVYVIGVFDVGPYVYYFFRELALESTQFCSRTYYSRVARVCKIDEGGLGAMNLRFTSFLKARLVCSVSSIGSSIPYQFNEIYDVKFDENSQTFYALFKTNRDSQWGSAVCHYLLSSVDSVFDTSLFLEQVNQNSAWQPILSGNLAPDPRPGQCSNRTKSFDPITYQFIRSHVLMADTISPAGSGRPLYYSRDLAFEKFAIDTLPSNTSVLYMYRQDGGELHRVALYSIASIPQQYTVSIWKPFTNASIPLSARTVIFHRPASTKWLYITTDVAVTQLSPEQCDSYTLCTDCIRDPYCGWSNVMHSCLPYEPGLLQNVTKEDAVSTCAATCKQTYTRSATVPGMAIHLNCSSYCSSEGDVRWWFRANGTADAKPITTDGNSNYVQSKDNGLTILMVNGIEHNGSFECRRDTGEVLTQHDVSMSVCEFGNNVREVWIGEYLKWCKRFTAYNSDYINWKCMKDQCVQQKCIPGVTACNGS